MSPEEAEVDRAMAAAWPQAQRYWSTFLLLSPPAHSDEHDSVAWMHLGHRQVSFNRTLIARKKLTASAEAILAHEVGHHVRFPASLSVEARLRLLEKPLLPIPDHSFTNLFEDLMINERLGHPLRDQLAAVYRAFRDELRWKRDSAFFFYMVVYEELWQLAPGDLTGRELAAFEEAHPGCRADAQLLVQNLFRLGPNLYTQFLYFVSVLLRYVDLEKDKKFEEQDPYQCGRGQPTPDDWADALNQGAREREAIARALREGWISEADAKRLGGEVEHRVGGLPGHGTADAELVPEIMAAWYRQQAERYLMRPPPRRLMGEAVVPTTLEEWSPSDPVQLIDWVATYTERGDVLGPAQPLRRERLADYEGEDVPLWQPRVELYLDVSGSMPDPRHAINAMTLAAQILATGAIRAQGWARAVLYSTGTVRYWEWCRSERELSRFLMHYIGAGTEFPFELLEESVTERVRGQPIRVIITDHDFHKNYEARPENADILRRAIAAAPVILLLHTDDETLSLPYARLGARVVSVLELVDFPGMAVKLSNALFERDSHAVR